MKKTVTINLGGIVFYIDEDAYQLLKEYLDNIRIYFKNHPDESEIVTDIEARFSELLAKDIKHQNQSIVINQVEEVIKRIGQPEDFDVQSEGASAGEAEPGSASSSSSEKKHGTGYSFSEFQRRKLYRNPDDKVIGGVAGGLAAYFRIDSTIMRLVLVALMFVTMGTTIVAYLVMWILVPQADTAIEKLNMYGEDVTVENIGKRVSEEASDVKKKDQTIGSRPAGGRVIDKIINAFGLLLKACFILIMIILAPVWLLVILILFMVTLSLLIGGSALLANMGGPFVGLTEGVSLWGSAAGLTVFIIPMAILLYLMLKKMLNLKPASKGVKWTVFIVWIVALIFFIISAATYQPPIFPLISF